ncbi:hypothetical protein C8A05DRAFT_12734 [Staphylotrichum tortipilum]|uniref:Zn(2)-C6 fungal-type domain-containing protein n=1 Tax=Staphylotrichum tortipilum TaxID=2831512 RepID=A0AAN6RWD5_9PEZI|nr:hypothetical protein C8A05DRAFT_12734 [Staphylotrichum longicolle]
MEQTASSPSNEGGSPQPLASPTSGGGQADQPAQPPARKSTVRKRTKTGCLTCRRRRIKCDEGKPTCSNCIKSKRECEGYSQRLTFKEPLGSFPSGHLYGHPAYHRQVQEALLNAQLSAAQSSPSSQGPLAIIAPKPPSVDFSGIGPPLHFAQGYGPPPPMTGPPGFSPVHHHPQSPLGMGPEPTGPFPDPPRPSLHTGTPVHPDFLPTQGFQQHHTPVVPDTSPILPHHPHGLASRPGPDQFLTSPVSAGGVGGGVFPPHQQPRPAEDGYWQSDDEASIGESDDDLTAAADHHHQLAHLDANDLGMQIASRLEPALRHDAYGLGVRSFGGGIPDNTLDMYTPSSASSPLNDPQTAAVFWCFVNVTGQSMSLYERHPFDPTPMFQGHPVPKQRQHIWTYTFPIMAFNHPALMQAMLALGALQTAKLQNLAPTAAMKHYHLSLRRIAKNYQSAARRTQPATLAATLLLGFYEVWNSDHDKWCKHMWGARAVIRDIPFRRMTREVVGYKRRQREREVRERGGGFGGDWGVGGGAEEVDGELIYALSGQRVDYGEGEGRVVGDGEGGSKTTERDVETYEQLRDLYWWYCKMDVYQSFLGGTRPL